MDIEENDKEYVIKADLPSIKREEVKVGIVDGVLTVEGERKQEKEEKGKKFHRVERSFGRFVRRIAVPPDVNEQKVTAVFTDGVLNVHLPKSEAAKPKSIDIKVGEGPESRVQGPEFSSPRTLDSGPWTTLFDGQFRAMQLCLDVA